MSEFTLSNGLHFIVLERHNAPVVSCSTYANVGAFDEENGKTGQRHFLAVELSGFASSSVPLKTRIDSISVVVC